MGKKRIRILVGKPGLDGHDVGAKIIVRALMQAGFEVIYTGLRNSPEEIVQAASQEDVDVLALSILSGSHVPICQRVGELLAENDLGEIVWIVGGNVPEKDHEALRSLGVDGVFGVGTRVESVVKFIREKVA